MTAWVDSPPRRRRLVALATLMTVVLAIGGWVLWRDGQSRAEEEARAYAAAFAGSLAAGTLPQGTDAPDPTLAAFELERILDGMGDLRHTVEVVSVEVAEDERTAAATLRHTWTIHADKQPWEYETHLDLARPGETWRGAWAGSVIAPELGAGEGLRATRLPPERGEILGDGDTVLVTERPVVRIGIDKVRAGSAATAQDSARSLAELLEIEVEPFLAAVTGAGERAFVEALVLREGSAQLTGVRDAVAAIPGTAMIGASLPLAPTAQFARPVLGSVGPATAEIIEKSGGAVRTGDLVGLAGLQAAQDERLRGVPGFDVEAYALDGPEEARSLHTVPAVDGQDVTISLSEAHQQAAEIVLAPVDPPSALVAIRPSDGHVLAVASGSGGPGYSTATLGQYPPGSTFKTVSALALLRAGLGADDTVACPDTITVEGRAFGNYQDYPASALGEVSLRTAFANSCNTAMIGARERLDDGALAGAAAALGLTGEPALGIPAALGEVPAPNADVDLAAQMIGQGTVVASPLGMATVAASVAAGAPVAPIVVLDPAGAAADDPADPVTADEAARLRELMRAVVTDGSGSVLADLPGEVMAKTGTAEYGGEVPPRTHAWMIAIRGDLAVAVFVEDGAGGAATAGPLLREFLEQVTG